MVGEAAASLSQAGRQMYSEEVREAPVFPSAPLLAAEGITQGCGPGALLTCRAAVPLQGLALGSLRGPVSMTPVPSLPRI